jgi:hypothetical protein
MSVKKALNCTSIMKNQSATFSGSVLSRMQSLRVGGSAVLGQLDATVSAARTMADGRIALCALAK